MITKQIYIKIMIFNDVDKRKKRKNKFVQVYIKKKKIKYYYGKNCAEKILL